MQSLSADFSILAAVYKHLCPFYCAEILGMVSRWGLIVVEHLFKMSFKDRGGSRGGKYVRRFQLKPPWPIASIKMNNPQFRKQAKVNFHANCSVTRQKCSLRIESIQLCSTVKREGHAIPAPISALCHYIRPCAAIQSLPFISPRPSTPYTCFEDVFWVLIVLKYSSRSYDLTFSTLTKSF